MKMFSSISCISVPITFPVAKSPVLCSLPDNNSSNSSSEDSSSPAGSIRRTRKARIPTSSSQPLQKKPSVAEIERAIGAGVFRDRDTDGDMEQKTLFDTILSNSIGESESSVEKKLRETGEWILEKTEGPSSRSAGKNILKTVFLLILPVWIISFLVAAGFVKLPFATPILDDWIL
ncbi:probable NAD(P)H dehydrogenase subunit CRR3, chloroplastic [Daucus carota subsp. sativus]|nr:PREDICTED: probable NAD(P)H dehydrogenase subunit CRR3, chloroplastic [Daucus carota subsp. sativus]